MASAIIEQARAEGRTLLSEVESKQLLQDAGVPTTGATLAGSGEEAAAAADAIGYPVVLKIDSPDIAHKSDVGGVVLGLTDRHAVLEAYDRIVESVRRSEPEATINGASVQRQAEPGVEVIIGMTRDPRFGPILMFGLGGILVELLEDVAFRLVPIEERDAGQMLSEIKASPLLHGFRGAPPADTEALKRLLLQLSSFAADHPEIEQIDLNPVFAGPEGAVAVDARVVLSPQ